MIAENMMRIESHESRGYTHVGREYARPVNAGRTFNERMDAIMSRTRSRLYGVRETARRAIQEARPSNQQR